RRRRVPFIDEVRKTEEFGGGIVESDVEVSGVHQLIDDAVYGGKELLQFVGAAALLGDAVECGTQRFDAPAVRNIVIASIEAGHLPIQQQRRTRQGNIEQGSIFFSALGFQGDALTSGERLG